MKNMINKYIQVFLFLVLTFVMFGNTGYSQTCQKYYKSKDCSEFDRNDFYLMEQSRSAVFEIGTSSQFEIALNGGRDYIISCCTDREYYPLNFIILSKDGGEVIYDNMHDEYLNSIGFTIDNTQNVILKITILAEGFKPSDFYDNRACVGVSIQFRKTPKIGFNNK